jgi:PAS domain S-box-containing protein
MTTNQTAAARRMRVRVALRRTATLANVLAGVIGLLGLLGWVISLTALRTFGAHFPLIQIGSVLSLVVGAAALHAAQRDRLRPALAGALLIVVLAVGTLVARAAGVTLGLDFAFLGLGAPDEARLMSVPLALAALGIAVGVALHAYRTPVGDALTEALATGIAALAFVALVGMTFRVLLFYAPAPLLGMSLPGAIGFMLLVLSLLAGRPDPWLERVLADERPGAVVTRWLMPAALLVPLGLGWLQLFAERLGIIDETLGAGLLTLLMTVVLGALALWIAAALDRSDASRRGAEADARAQRERLQVVLASIGDGVIATDRDGHVRFVNPAAEAFTGWTAMAASGRPLAELLDVVDGVTEAPVESPLDRALQERRTVAAGGEPAVRARGGAVHPVELVAAPLRDERGEIAGGVLVLRDAAMRREGERAMREAYAELDRRVMERTRLLAQITASTADLIHAQDLEGRILLANPAWLKARAMTEARVLGRRTLDLASEPRYGRQSEAEDRRVIESGQSSVVEEQFAHNGGSRTYLTTKSPLRDERGRIVGLIGVATDITDRKRAERELERLFATEQRLREEAERANRAKDEFLAIVSHELRSPLNALRGWAHLLASTRPLDPALVERATAAIKRSVEHQARLIDDLLDTARIMSGKLTLERRSVDLVEVVNAALELVRPLAAAKHVELRATIDQPVVVIKGDSGRLQQVVTNLLSNAIKFTPENGAVETIIGRAGDQVQLAVCDNGIGIAPEFLPHVFDRFTQADTSTTRRAGGLGIGLALVRHLVELHGGAVHADSPGTGQGARFTIRLPGAEAAAPALRADDAQSERHGREATLAGRTVFVIDDDADVRETLGFVLRQAGADVEVFAAGSEMAARIAELLSAGDPPDVLLLDLAMPEEDGFAVLARVRAVERAGGAARKHLIPALAVTAFTEFDREQLATAGFRGLVAKPVDRERLLRAILLLFEEVTVPAGVPAESAESGHGEWRRDL